MVLFPWPHDKWTQHTASLCSSLNAPLGVLCVVTERRRLMLAKRKQEGTSPQRTPAPKSNFSSLSHAPKGAQHTGCYAMVQTQIYLCQRFELVFAAVACCWSAALFECFSLGRAISFGEGQLEGDLF